MNRKSASTPRKRGIQAILVLPAMIFLSVAVHGIFSDYQQIQTQRRRLEARTATAEGTIVKLYDTERPHRWEHSGLAVKAETVVFTAASGQRIEFSAYADNGDQVGMKMLIHYDPLHPDNFAVDKFAAKEKNFGLLDLIFENVFPLGMGVYFLFLVFWVGSKRSEELSG